MTSGVSIGMPVRNGASHIATAIRSLQGQLYRDWHLLISDNASTDATAAICREFAIRDERISLVVQKFDIGAAENFRFVLSKARQEYFMWAAADDVWDPQFMDACVSALVARPDRGVAFTGIENIDANGHVLRRYPQLAGLGGPPSFLTVARFLLHPEILGKANLVYGLYRTTLCRDVMSQVGFPACWGSDMVFVLGAIARAGLYIEPKVLFQKRVDASRETVSAREAKLRFLPGNGFFPLDAYPDYRASLLVAVRGTRFELGTQAIMKYRYLRAVLAARVEALRAHARSRFN